MRHSLDSLKRDILIRGSDDWVHIAEIAELARRYGHEAGDGDSTGPLPATDAVDLAALDRASLPLGITAVKELLREGLVQIGDVTDRGFVAWQGGLDEILVRIDDVVRNAQFPLLPGSLFWTENTHQGDAAVAGMNPT